MEFKEAKYQDLTVKELNVGDFLPLVEIMSEEPMKAQLGMLQKCVYGANGELLGEAGIKGLPSSCYMGLWNTVKEVHGMNEKKD